MRRVKILFAFNFLVQRVEGSAPSCCFVKVLGEADTAEDVEEVRKMKADLGEGKKSPKVCS